MTGLEKSEAVLLAMRDEWHCTFCGLDVPRALMIICGEPMCRLCYTHRLTALLEQQTNAYRVMQAEQLNALERHFNNMAVEIDKRLRALEALTLEELT